MFPFNSTMKEILKDEQEIADYIEEISPLEVDRDLIEEMFRGCRAELRKVQISWLKIKFPNNNLKDPSKQKAYDKLNTDEAPPVVADGEDGVLYGYHRLQSAKKQCLEVIWAYCVIPN